LPESPLAHLVYYGENRTHVSTSVNNINKPVIGLVGGVCSGKSTASAEFAALGCRVIDADAAGHALLREDAVRQAIRARWGDGVFGADGQVSRSALGKLVFADAAEMAALNAIMHPPMRREFQRQITAALADPAVPAVVLDAAVLFEAGWNDLCTCVVFVEASLAEREARAAGRGWDAAALASREKMQIPLDKKRAKCDYLLQNSSGVSRLREQVRTLCPRILHAAV
jgi:dephospho-CoA kinase